MIFAVPGPIRGNVSGITDREQMKIRRIPYSIDSLKCSGLLPGNSVRVDRIYNGEIIALSKLAHDPKCVVEVAFNSHDFCSVDESLQQFTACDLSRRQNYRARNSCPRRIRCR